MGGEYFNEKGLKELGMTPSNWKTPGIWNPIPGVVLLRGYILLSFIFLG
jgi:hypothetical protein